MKRSTLSRAIAAACAAAAVSQASAGPQEDLAACGAIADPTERLACYDRVAGRPAAPAPAASRPASPVSPASASPPAVAAPAPTAPPPMVAAPASRAAATPSQAGAAAQPASRPADAQSFGSYTAEHPTAPPAVPQTLTVRVTKLGKTIDGKPTVTLEGGALWLLDERDPLLDVGDTVTISRGLLGSFLLETPTKRLHHVRRIS